MKQLYFFLFLSAIAMADDTNLEAVFHTASNQFTGNFFSQAVAENNGKSIVTSAYSIMTPLALLSLVAVGPSHDELLNAIGLPNDNVTKAVFSLAESKIRSIKGVELKAANKIYIPVGYQLNSEFAAVSRDIFRSEVKNINFLQNVQAAKEINDWVENETNQRIKDLVDPNSLDGNTRAVLVNALYFKGSWVTPFQKMLTREEDFHVTKNKVVSVSMMHNKADYLYGESERLQAKILVMPYEGEQTSMVILLPYKIDGIKDLLHKVRDMSLLDEESKKLFTTEVDVSIPKFKIETTTDIKDILQKMNVKRLFSPGEANLNKLLTSPEELYVSSATQKAFIEVNEEGAEAAAANQFGISYLSAVINPKEYNFNADHSFVFLLKEGTNVLFSGIFCG